MTKLKPISKRGTKAKRRAKRQRVKLRTAQRQLALYQLAGLQASDGTTRHVTFRLPAKLLDDVQALAPDVKLSRLVVSVLRAGMEVARG